MSSDRAMYALLAAYAVLVALSIYDGLWGRAVYWLGAIIISVGVLMQR